MNKVFQVIQHIAFVIFAWFLSVFLFAPTGTMTRKGGEAMLFIIRGNYGLFLHTMLAGLIASAAVWLGLLVLLTAREGYAMDKVTKKRVIRTSASDELPLEIRLIMLLVFLLPYLFVIYSNRFTPFMRSIMNGNNPEFIWVIGLAALFTSLLFSFFYYGFVRRIRGKLIWKTSIIAKLVNKISALSGDIYRNAGPFAKALIPFAILVVGALLILILLRGIIRPPVVTYRTVLTIIFCYMFLTAGVCVFLNFREHKERQEILQVLQKISSGNTKTQVNAGTFHGDNCRMAEAVNEIGRSVQNAVMTSMKDEKMKADLITNVSHDLKTPLTSIISYVDLLKNENIENENAQNYIAILDEKSQRLKQLTDDLVEVSKISSGNIVLQNEPLNVKELLNQAVGEFYEKFEEKKLEVVNNLPKDPVMIKADSRSIYRVIENLFTNIYKYALEGTRVYLDVQGSPEKTFISIKNISANPLGITAEELTERFIRGDESRSSEGAGLGLSIAKSLTEAMEGSFQIVIDGDLFKVELGMPNA